MASLILISSTMGRSISLALLLAGYKNTGLSWPTFLVGGGGPWCDFLFWDRGSRSKNLAPEQVPETVIICYSSPPPPPFSLCFMGMSSLTFRTLLDLISPSREKVYPKLLQLLLLIYLTTFIASTLNYVIAKNVEMFNSCLIQMKKNCEGKHLFQENFIRQNENFKIHSLFNRRVSKPLRFYDNNICSILSSFKWDNPSYAYPYIPSISSYLVHRIKIVQQCHIAHPSLKKGFFFCSVWFSC